MGGYGGHAGAEEGLGGVRTGLALALGLGRCGRVLRGAGAAYGVAQVQPLRFEQLFVLRTASVKGPEGKHSARHGLHCACLLL